MDLEDQYDKLYRYCYFRVRDVQTAEDLVQETFLRWLDHYPGQRERGGNAVVRGINHPPHDGRYL